MRLPFAMAPFKSRINSAFHRMNDRLKRHRYGDDEASYSKQPRIFPSHSMLSKQNNLSSLAPPGEPSFPLPPLPPQTPGLPPASQAALSLSCAPEMTTEAPSPTSYMSLEYVHSAMVTEEDGVDGPAGTLADPIDLTDNPGPSTSTTSPFTPAAGGLAGNPIDLTYSSPHASCPSAASSLDKGKEKGLGQLSPSTMAQNMYPGGTECEADLSRGPHRSDDDVRKEREYSRILQVELASLAANTTQSWSKRLTEGSGSASSPPPASVTTTPPLTFQANADLQAFHSSIWDASCSRCSSRLVHSADEIIQRTKRHLTASDLLHPCVACGKCGTWTCVGCRTQHGLHETQPDTWFTNKLSGHDYNLAWCCDQGRLFLIWSLCCGISLEKPSLPHSGNGLGRLIRDRLIPPMVEKVAALPTPKAFSKGTGYGMDFDSNTPMPPPRPAVPLHMVVSEDDGLEPYFHALSALLPSAMRTWKYFELDPPNILPLILGRSPLLFKAMEILRNDSIEHVSEQLGVCEAVLDFVDALRNSPKTLTFLLDEFALYGPDEQIPQLYHRHATSHFLRSSLSSGSEKQKAPEKCKAIVDVMKNLATQCHHFAQAAQSPSSRSDFQSDSGKRLLGLCQRICTVRDSLEGTRKATGVGIKEPLSAVLTRTRAMDKAVEDLRQWHRDNSIADLPDDEIMENHYFKRHALAVATQVSAKGRMKKLLSQISVLRTSLPEGIFVRHCTSRLDVMKFLIIGPAGTPYEHGIFEFDLFCPATFPQTPPQLSFRTTDAGKVRFNPNLYEDGKVCLSLLGTWAGEPWDPNRSTLLQVLVSLQAMIFTGEPWYNEPGRERCPNKTESDRYNTLIQQYTMQHALLHWLNHRIAAPSAARPFLALLAGSGGKNTSTQPDDPIWGEIVRKHFSAHAKAISETAKKWKGRKRNDSNHGRLAAELRDALMKHEFL